MDILQLLKNWFMSEKSDLEPSLLAYVLLFTTKNVTGLIIIMEHLTTFWNEDEARNKAKCTELLAQVVLPSQSDLDSKSVQAIISFLTRGLKDVTTAGRSIDILSILINAEHIQRTDVILLCDAIFKNVQMKKLPQNSRWKVFNILDTALEKYSLELQASKVNFIEGFIDCMDGEKDPRNLLIAFHLFRTLIDKFDISQHVEELFDVVFCYFPISFTAPAGDILGITSSELKESLRRCFAATPYFGYFATPLLIEKLMKSTGTAKKDAMETISLCTPAYGANVILPHVDELFKALVKEVYQGTDITTVNIALNTIYHVVATLATGVSIANIRDPVEKSIGSLLDQCVDKLSEPELKNARSASHILRAVASASDPACTSVTHAVLPVLYEKYSPRDPIIRQKAILDILTELLTASKNLYGSIENLEYDRDFQTPLLIYKQQIMQIFVLSLIESSAEDASLMESCLRGIHEMISMKQFLNNGEIDITVNHLSRLLIDRGNQLKSLILPTLKIVAKAYPTILRKHTFPMLFHLLPSEATPVISDNYKEVLEMIEILGLYPATFKIIVASLMENLNYACYSIGVYNSEYVHAIAHTILHLYKSTSADKEILQYGIKSLIPLFMKKCIEYSTTSDKHWYLDIDLLNIFSMIIAVTVRQSRTSEQEEAVNDLFRQFSVIDTLNSTTSHQVRLFDPLDNGKIDISILFTAVVGNCRKDISLPISSPRTFLLEILKTIQNTTSDNKRASLTKLFATIINKWADDELILSMKNVILENLTPLITLDDLNRRRRMFSVYIWFMKSLLLRSHKYGFELLDNLLELCHSLAIGREAANSFSTLLYEDELLLNKLSHAKVSILFMQRIFNYCCDKLLKNLQHTSNQPDLEINYSLALSNILENIPNQIIVIDIHKLMLPIIRALSLGDEPLILSMLKIAQDIIPTSQSVINKHLGCFIDALLKLTVFNSIKVRVVALNNLKLLSVDGDYDCLMKYKDVVIKSLAPALDDKKRIVRKNAVDCREQWYTIKKKSQ